MAVASQEEAAGWVMCDASLPDACGPVLVPCGLSPARGAFVSVEQAYEGHLVDALALRGDEGRSTLR